MIDFFFFFPCRYKTYHSVDAYESLIYTPAFEMLHMSDIEIDDDEWQIAAWYMKDQQKKDPMSIIDESQDLFAVTHTFRAREMGGEAFKIYSRNEFYQMFGTLPANFDESQFGELTVCPYEYSVKTNTWTNTITGGNPLIFHFAGHEWLCACEIMAAENFELDSLFGQKCDKELNNRVENAIQMLAGKDADAYEELHVPIDITSASRRHLRNLDGYGPADDDDDRRARKLGEYGPDDDDDRRVRNLGGYGPDDDDDRRLRKLGGYGPDDDDDDRRVRNLGGYGPDEDDDRRVRKLGGYGPDNDDDDRRARKLSGYGPDDEDDYDDRRFLKRRNFGGY